MKLIITIPEDKYWYIKNLEQGNTDYATTRMLYHAVKHGKPYLEHDKWIPCSERLPFAECGESESVICCLEDGTQEILYFNGSNWCYPTGESYPFQEYKTYALAWMPLPKPWKEVEE